MRLLRHRPACRPTASTHSLRRGLPGYLILFAPHAFAPQRQYRSSEPPSPLVFFLISTNFTSTLGIPLTSIGLETCSIQGSSEVEPRDFTPDLQIRLRAVCAHCPIFPTAASRRSLGRVSVPVWLVILSNQLRIVALVSHYLTN